MPYSSYHVPRLSTVFSPVTANILHNTLTHILTLSYLAYQYKPSPPRCHALDGDAPYSTVGHNRFLEWSAAYPFPSILHAVVVHVQWVLVVSPNVLPPPLLFYPNSDVSRSPPMLELHPGLCWSLVTHLQPLILAEPLAFHVSIDCFLMSLDFWSSSPPCSWIDLLHPTIFPPQPMYLCNPFDLLLNFLSPYLPYLLPHSGIDLQPLLVPWEFEPYQLRSIK